MNLFLVIAKARVPWIFREKTHSRHLSANLCKTHGFVIKTANNLTENLHFCGKRLQKHLIPSANKIEPCSRRKLEFGERA
jgi:hypothetical protein